MTRMAIMIAVIGIIALFALGCSQVENPTAPRTISAISFPADGNDDSDLLIQPMTPYNLKGAIDSDQVKLCWQHVDLAPGWFRIYVSRDGGPYELVRCTDCRMCLSCVGCGWNRLVYRVSAVNEHGIESEMSQPIIFKRSDSEQPHEATGQDDMDN